jgi:hypothetical protein
MVNDDDDVEGERWRSESSASEKSRERFVLEDEI